MVRIFGLKLKDCRIMFRGYSNSSEHDAAVLMGWTRDESAFLSGSCRDSDCWSDTCTATIHNTAYHTRNRTGIYSERMMNRIPSVSSPMLPVFHPRVRKKNTPHSRSNIREPNHVAAVLFSFYNIRIGVSSQTLPHLNPFLEDRCDTITWSRPPGTHSDTSPARITMHGSTQTIRR